MSASELPEYVQRNRDYWDDRAKDHVRPGERGWAENRPKWGIWGVPEEDVGLLPDEIDGKDGIELGCGTGYVSSWLARRGARMVGIDNSEVQLATARRLQAEHGIDFPLHHGNAEEVPYPDESFDFAISEYGASLWADPDKWIPEAARLLRPGGQLLFFTNSFLMILCAPDGDDTAATNELLRPALGMHRVEFPSDPAVEFHLAHADWIRLLRENGFEVEAQIDVYPREDATTRYPFVTLEWARKWPCEEAWKARKRS